MCARVRVGVPVACVGVGVGVDEAMCGCGGMCVKRWLGVGRCEFGLVCV